MPLDHLDPASGLVVVDLQQGLTSLPAAHPVDGVVERSAALVDGFRAAGRPVVLMVIDFAPDGADAARHVCEIPSPPSAGSGFAALDPRLGSNPRDVHVTKKGWSGFCGTDLELQLRRRGVHTIVLCGIATSIGVESTAREAFDRDFDLVIVPDCMTDPELESHEHSLRHIYPRLGLIDTSEKVLACL